MLSSQVDIAYIPFVERFQIFLSEAFKYDITAGRPKLALWIEVYYEMHQLFVRQPIVVCIWTCLQSWVQDCFAWMQKFTSCFHDIEIVFPASKPKQKFTHEYGSLVRTCDTYAPSNIKINQISCAYQFHHHIIHLQHIISLSPDQQISFLIG